MSKFSFVKSELRSRLIREAVTGEFDGLRVIGQEPEENRLVQFFRDAGQNLFRVGGSILTWKGHTGWSWSQLANALVSSVRGLWNFNWQISDQQIDQMFQNIKLRLIGQLGGTLGNLVGWLVCGAGPGILMLRFNKALAVHVLREVGEEGLEELVSNLALLARQSAVGLGQWLFYQTFKNARKFIKWSAKNPTSLISQTGRQIFGSSFDNMVQSWGEEGSKPWSFSLAFNEWIDNITNPEAQEFTEEFFDEAFDACQEAVFVVAQGIDSFLLEQELAKNQLLGSEETIEILPDRSADRDGAERIILSGKEELLKPALVHTLASYQLLDNRDVGQIIGEPVTDAIRDAEWETQMTILWRGVASPPWRDSIRTQCTIKGIKRTKLDWALIKQLAGGFNGRLWGRFECIAKTNIGEPRLWAATGEDGIKELEALLILLTDQIVYNIDPREETKTGVRKTYDTLFKEPTRVYPASVTIINKNKILNELDGRAESSGVYKERRYRIPLWVDKQPPEWDEMMTEIFAVRGVTP